MPKKHQEQDRHLIVAAKYQPKESYQNAVRQVTRAQLLNKAMTLGFYAIITLIVFLFGGVELKLLFVRLISRFPIG